MSSTVKLLAYIMRVEPNLYDKGVMHAYRIDKRGSFASKHVEYKSATIEALCAAFALDVSRQWNGTDTTPVHIVVDRDPTTRKPRGYDKRPHGRIFNVPPLTFIMH